MNIFEQATIQKLRFESTRGELTTEMLFDLPLQAANGFDLDTVAKTVNSALKQTQEESFVSKATAAQSKHALKLDIVKSVIAYKVAEKEAASNQVARRAEREQLMTILASKQAEKLGETSIEDLQKRIKDLS